ncbi:klc-2, partial [Symbiodinium necroappetens]
MYRLMGQLDKAEPLQRRVLSSQEASLGQMHNVTVSSVTHLAHLLKEKGRYVEAEALYRRALMTRETKYG